MIFRGTDLRIVATLKTAQLVAIYVDQENAAEEFWNAVDTQTPPDDDAALLRQLKIGVPLIVGPEVARRILAWARTLPEWDAVRRPIYARHPLLFLDADEVSRAD